MSTINQIPPDILNKALYRANFIDGRTVLQSLLPELIDELEDSEIKSIDKLKYNTEIDENLENAASELEKLSRVFIYSLHGENNFSDSIEDKYLSLLTQLDQISNVVSEMRKKINDNREILFHFIKAS